MANPKKAKTPAPRPTSRLWILAGLGLVVVAVVGWRLLDRAGGPAPGASVGTARGEALFRQNCAPCHGPTAGGEMPGQPLGGVKSNGQYIAPALNGTGHAWHHPPGMLFRIVKFGSPAKESPMRAWQGKMEDPEIQGVLDYLMTLWPPQLRARYRRIHSS